MDKVWDEKTYSEFKEKLKSLAKPESEFDRQRHIAIIATKQYVYGLKMCDIHALAKEISKNEPLEFLKLAKNDSYEETLIQGIVIAGIKDLELQKNLFLKWVKNIDSWSTCDATVSSMKILKKSKEKGKYFEHYENLCFSSKEFVARFGIIVLMTCYLEEEYIDELLAMCKKVTNEKYYVQMGLAWLISFAFMKFRDKTYGLLKEKCLPKFVQNKAISKCRDSYQVSDEDKEKLISLRIK